MKKAISVLIVLGGDRMVIDTLRSYLAKRSVIVVDIVSILDLFYVYDVMRMVSDGFYTGGENNPSILKLNSESGAILSMSVKEILNVEPDPVHCIGVLTVFNSSVH
jgi:hypothetical protein